MPHGSTAAPPQRSRNHLALVSSPGRAAVAHPFGHAAMSRPARFPRVSGSGSISGASPRRTPRIGRPSAPQRTFGLRVDAQVTEMKARRPTKAQSGLQSCRLIGDGYSPLGHYCSVRLSGNGSDISPTSCRSAAGSAVATGAAEAHRIVAFSLPLRLRLLK